MAITIRYFASLKDRVGCAQQSISASPGLTAASAWQLCNPALALPDNVLVAVNQEYAALDAPLGEGDEVAFFPPVTGG